MPAHLHLRWPSWFDRNACAAHSTKTGMMLGVDLEGNCIWWDGDQPQEQHLRWECVSDGTCEQSASSRATFESEAACIAGCAHAWECISDTLHSANSGARYCLPRTNLNGSLTSVATPTQSVYTSIGACEAACGSAYSDGNGIVSIRRQYT